MMLARSVRALLTAGLLVSLGGCDIQVNEKGISVDITEGKATDEWSRRYTLAPGGHLQIVNVNGTIQAGPATGPQVEVVAQREVNSESTETAREMLSKIEMVEEVSPDRVAIEARTDWQGAGRGFGRRSNVSIEYRVALPPGLNVTLKTENGGVRLENVDGVISASSTNGGVTGHGVSGAVAAATVNGGVQMEFASVRGDTEIVTVNGGIRLELPRDVDAMLDARAVNGGVTVDEQLSMRETERGRGHVAGQFNDGGPRVSVQTTNGGIRVSARESGARQPRP